MFGLRCSGEKLNKVVDPVEIAIAPKEVVYITGGSGAGKSVMLQLLRERMPEAIDLHQQHWPCDKPVVDCFDCALDETMCYLSMAGLSDTIAMLRRPEELSDGQRYRLRLAMAMSQKPSAIFIDEFCNRLDRITAAVVAHNVRKFADKFDTTFIVATSHDDLLEDLRPDIVVVKFFGGQCNVYYPHRRMGA